MTKFEPFVFCTFSGKKTYGISDGRFILENFSRKMSLEKATKICAELNK